MIVIDFRLFWGIRAVLYKAIFKKVGFPCYLGQPLFLKGIRNITLGNRVGIFPGLRAEVFGERGAIDIKDRVSIGQNFHIIASDKIEIGSGTIISANVLVNDLDNELSEIEKRYSDRTEISRETRIGKNCFIGYGAAIMAGTILEDYCVVGANSVVRGHFKKGSVIAGVPGKVIRELKLQ